MKAASRYDYLHGVAAFASGILAFLAIGKINFWLSWICLVPFFLVLLTKPPKASLKFGFLFGMGMSLFSFYWMIPGAERFTGNSIVYGFIIFLICTTLFSLYWALLSACFSFLKVKFSNGLITDIANGLLIAFIIITGEYFLNALAAGMPWFACNTGYGLMSNLYAIQPVAWLGLPVLTFVVVIVNYAIARIIKEKQYIKLLLPASGVLVFLMIGYFILTDFERWAVSPSKTVNVAILSENIPPDVKWDAANGERLVNRLLDLAQKALLLKPDIALWSESAVPWTYEADDPLVQELLKITAPASITHILGMNTVYAENVVLNSVYCLLPNKAVAGRYDKRFLLSFIEAPLGDMIFPFLSSSGYYVQRGQTGSPLNTPYGKAGVMVCNEAVVSDAAADMVDNGAEYLLVLSNDGWFQDTYIAKQHFYHARLRAIEARKDVAVNSNNGISGLIKASGRIEWMERSDDPFVKVASVVPNDFDMESFKPMLLIYMGFVVLLFFLFNSVFNYFNKS